MTPKEALEMLNKCGTNTEQPYEDMILEALDHALIELEELKRDVKRYFHDNDLEGDEYNMLWSKLMKVGNGK